MVGLMVAAISGCTEGKDAYSHIQSPPAKLMGAYRSYEQQSAVLAALRSRGQTFIVVEDVKLSADDPRPRYEFYEIELPDQEYCGERGALRLSFFNQRLSSTTFYPAHSKECLERLPYPKLRSGKNEMTSGETKIVAGVDYRNLPYVAWHDQRLISELDRWVSKYS